jgi:alanine dehydrogenase
MACRAIVQPKRGALMLLLARDDVTKVLDMKECVQAVEGAFLEMAEGTAFMPLRNHITTPHGLALYMPAFLQKAGALACKVVTSYPANPANHNMPTILGKVLLQDPETGDVICIMDGEHLTAVRTGAASGVATKYLAREDRGQVAGIFGAGVQAKSQLWAVATVRELSLAYVYDIHDRAAQDFAVEMGEKLGVEVRKAGSPAQVLEAADIICTATTSRTPIFDGSKVREGTHLNCVGSHTPDARELDTEIVKRSRVIADSYDACLNEAGDIIIPIKEGAIDRSHLAAELGEVISGKKKGRTGSAEITMFKSNGLAIQDAAAAKLVYEKALAVGIGREVRL